MILGDARGERMGCRNAHWATPSNDDFFYAPLGSVAQRKGKTLSLRKNLYGRRQRVQDGENTGDRQG